MSRSQVHHETDFFSECDLFFADKDRRVWSWCASVISGEPGKSQSPVAYSQVTGAAPRKGLALVLRSANPLDISASEVTP